MFGVSLPTVAFFAASGCALAVGAGAVGFVVLVMSFTPWLLNDLSIKAGGQGLSGQTPEIPVDFHQRDREGGVPVCENVLVIVAADFEGEVMPVHVDMDDLVGRVDHFDPRAGE